MHWKDFWNLRFNCKWKIVNDFGTDYWITTYKNNSYVCYNKKPASFFKVGKWHNEYENDIPYSIWLIGVFRREINVA